MKIEPLLRKSLAEKVASVIEFKVKNGDLVLNEKLPNEGELMKQFGVGRSTIREAIKYLTKAGFLIVKQGLGTFVKSLTGNEELTLKFEKGSFDEIFEVRQTLELKLIEKSATNRQPKDLDCMETALLARSRFANANDLPNCIKADIAFHSAIAESCGNDILVELYKTLSIYVNNFYLETIKDISPFLNSQKHHEDLMSAIKSKDIYNAKIIANKIIQFK